MLIGMEGQNWGGGSKNSKAQMHARHLKKKKRQLVREPEYSLPVLRNRTF